MQASLDYFQICKNYSQEMKHFFFFFLPLELRPTHMAPSSPTSKSMLVRSFVSNGVPSSSSPSIKRLVCLSWIWKSKRNHKNPYIFKRYQTVISRMSQQSKVLSILCGCAHLFQNCMHYPRVQINEHALPRVCKLYIRLIFQLISLVAERASG